MAMSNPLTIAENIRLSYIAAVSFSVPGYYYIIIQTIVLNGQLEKISLYVEALM